MAASSTLLAEASAAYSALWQLELADGADQPLPALKVRAAAVKRARQALDALVEARGADGDRSSLEQAFLLLLEDETPLTELAWAAPELIPNERGGAASRWEGSGRAGSTAVR